MLSAFMCARRTSTWAAILALPIGLCAAALVPAYVNHDAAWYLHMADVWLDGGTLYRDVVDTNPPLVVFISAVPVWVARVSAISAPAAFKAWVFALALLSTALAIAPIRRAWNMESSRLLVATALAFALFSFVKDELGQREHLAAILTAPFVLQACAWAASGAAGPRADVVSGVLAGLGFALKPHFLLAWIAVEISLIVMCPGSRTWRRRGTIAVAVTIAIYAVVVITLVPAYRSVAREVMDVYGGLNEPVAVLLRVVEVRVWIVALVVTIAAMRLRSVQRGPSIVLFAAASGFLLAAMLQFKGWGYHLYPFRAFAVVFFAGALGSVLDAYNVRANVARGAPAATAAVVVLLTLWSTRAAVQARRASGTGYAASLIDVIAHQHADSMALLSMRFLLFPAFPAVNYSGATWVLRHNSLWFLPGLYVDELNKPDGDAVFRPIDAMPPLERKYLAEIVDDLCARPPHLLVIEPPVRGAPPGRRSLDLVAYYSQDPRFARLFSQYAPVTTIGPFVAYTRRGAASCQR